MIINQRKTAVKLIYATKVTRIVGDLIYFQHSKAFHLYFMTKNMKKDQSIHRILHSEAIF